MTESLITGKERDSETGLDYFGARYYGSNMGRWMSPDWAVVPTTVPYAQFGDPQSLNLYGYVRNNPLSMADPDGHCPPCEVEDALRQYAIEHPEQVAAVLAGVERASAAVETAALATVGRIAGGAAGFFGLAMAFPQALPGGKVGQSDADERAAIQQAQHEREQQNGGADPQAAAGGAGARQGGGRMTNHGQERADQAAAGDTHRQVGDANRVVSQGRTFTDTETGATIHVRGNRVVVTGTNGQVTRFKNTRAQTQAKIRSGKWKPNN